MKKEDELIRNIPEMIKETKSGKLKWKIMGQTTEYNDLSQKPKVSEEGTEWIVDECYISYECEYKGEEFLMITYEMIHSSGDKNRTTNLIFMPPLGIRFFDIHALLPYAITASQMLVYSVHTLWMAILETYKERPEQIEFDMSPRELSIDEEDIDIQ